MSFFKYFVKPFAVIGDQTSIPDDTQPSGEVSFDDGYGFDYQREQGVDPDALDLERDKFNYLAYAVTKSIQELQQRYVPNFITAVDNGGVDYSYSKKDRVALGGEIYESLINSNTDTPPSANWAVVPLSSQSVIPSASAAGTADAITAAFSPALTAFDDTTVLLVRAAAANATTTPTFNPDGLGDDAIYKGNNQALSIGDIAGLGYWMWLKRDDTLGKWQLMNPFTGTLASAITSSAHLTSGATYPVSGISGAKSVEITFEDVSCTASDEILMIINAVVTGYGGTAGNNGGNTQWATSSAQLTRSNTSSIKVSGKIILTPGRGDIWTIESTLGPSTSSGNITVSVGRVNLGAALTGFTISFSGAGTFDDGYISHKVFYI